jgi:hypothetical protein
MMKTFGVLLLFALSGLACDAPSDLPPEVRPVPTTTPATSVPQTAPEAPIRPDLGQPIPVPTTLPDTPCAEWYPIAVETGFPETTWERMSQIMWRESRCQPDAHYANDPNGGSFGLMQINGFWCKPRWAGDVGWLQAAGVLDTCLDLYHPEINIEASFHIFIYNIYQHGPDRGWYAWRT